MENNNFDPKNIEFHGELESDKFYLSISLTNSCNYQCSYCSAKAINYRNKELDFPRYEDIIDIINRAAAMYDKVYITLSGGEPTLHPNFIDIIKHIANLKDKVILFITSNASNSVEYYDNVFSIIKDIELVFQISIHLEFIKDLTHIKELIILSHKYKIYINTIIMCHPLLFEKAKSIIEELYSFKESFNFNIWTGIIYKEEENSFSILDERYTDEYLEYIRNIKKLSNNNNYSNILHKNNVIYKIITKDKTITIKNKDMILDDLDKKRSFKDMYCCYGIKNMFIWDCGIALGGVCNIFKKNYIYNKTYNWIDNIGYIKCPFELCLCILNDTLPKFRNEEDAKKYVENYKKENAYLFLNDTYKQLSILENNMNTNNEYITSILNNNFNIIAKIINSIAWWIQVKKWRDNFRNKILYDAEQ